MNIEPDSQYTTNDTVKTHTVCKGTPHNISANFPLELYKSCIFSPNTIVKSTMHKIRVKKRKLHTLSITKQAMSSGDDKRFQTCKLHSVPYGSKYAKYDVCVKCSK